MPAKESDEREYSGTQKFISALVGIALLFGLGLWGFNALTGDSDDQADTGPVPEYSIASLVNKYAANEAKAQQEYGRQSMIVRGRVLNVRLQGVQFDPGVFRNQYYVSGTFKSRDRDQLVDLKKGQMISIRCDRVNLIRGVGTPTVALGSCRLPATPVAPR